MSYLSFVDYKTIKGLKLKEIVPLENKFCESESIIIDKCKECNNENIPGFKFFCTH